MSDIACSSVANKAGRSWSRKAVVVVVAGAERARMNGADSRASHSYFPTGNKLYLISTALTWLSTLLPRQWNMSHAELAQSYNALQWEDWNTRLRNTRSYRCIDECREEGVLAHAWVLVYKLVHSVCDIVCSCVGLRTCVPSQITAEEPHLLINCDEWLEIGRPTPVSLSESFYLTLQGIVPCDVASVLLS